MYVGLLLSITGQALLSYAEHCLGSDPASVALVGCSQTREPVSLTFSDLAEQVRRARNGLHRLGVIAGDRVAARDRRQPGRTAPGTRPHRTRAGGSAHQYRQEARGARRTDPAEVISRDSLDDPDILEPYVSFARRHSSA